TARRRRCGVLRVRRPHRRAPARSLWLYDLLVPTTATGFRGAGPTGVLLLVGTRHPHFRRFAGFVETVALAMVRRLCRGGRRVVSPIRAAGRGAFGVADRRFADRVAGAQPDARYPRPGPEPGRHRPFPARPRG